MTDTKWTPGPWIAREHPEGRAGVSLRSGPMIARCEGMFGRGHVSASEWEANARLIAAAPDLYEALDWAVNEFDGNTRYDRANQLQNCIEKCRDALAKARGEMHG